MWSRITAMIVKEFGELARDKPILLILLWGFTGVIYSAGHAISMEIRDYPVVVYDLSQSVTSRELVSRLQKPYFKIVRYARSDDEVVHHLDAGKASLALLIPPNFERDLREGRKAGFQVLSDGTLSMSATIRLSQPHRSGSSCATARGWKPGRSRAPAPGARPRSRTAG